VQQPSKKQIEQCALMNWIYIGDGYFARGDELGWFENGDFKREC
jgi:hypothetical protein